MARGRGKLTPQDIEYMKIFSSNLNNLLEKNNIKQVELSQATQIPKSTLTGYVKGTSLPIPGNVQKIADFFNIKKSELDMRFDTAPTISFPTINKDTDTLTQITSISATLVDFRQRKVLDYATAQKREQDSKIREENVTYIYKGRESAAGATILGDDSTLDYEVVSSSMVPRGANELVDITGDSMEPLIMKGSSVYIRHQPTVENGEIAIVRIEDGVTCKRFYHKDSKVILKSENPNYDDIIIESELVHIIGKVLI